MSEFDPSLPLKFNDQPFEATRHNTTIFTFWASQAIFNHCFVQTGSEDDAMIGAYVFCDNPAFEYITEHADRYDWPMVLNRLSVPQCDLDAWDRAHLGDLRGSESFPEDWDGADT